MHMAATSASNLTEHSSLLVGGYGKLGVVYDSTIRAIKKKAHKQLFLIEFNEVEKGIEKFHLLRKKMKRIGGISILDKYFAEKYLKGIDIDRKPKYVMLINILSNSSKSFSKEKRKLKKIIPSFKLIPLPKHDYNKQLEEFWMLRVFLLLPNRKD